MPAHIQNKCRTSLHIENVPCRPERRRGTFFVLQNGNCISYIFLIGFFSVFIDLRLILFSVRQTSCTADAAACTSHSLDKVSVQRTL